MNEPEEFSALQHRVIFGDAREMCDLAAESVQLIVTSPPYWQLKDYGAENQIGFHDSYAEYIANLDRVWAECFRVLNAGCRLCINIGDQFARAAHYGRYKVIPIRERIVHACEALGMDYMGAVIWQKATTMNTSGGGAIMGSFPHPRNGILKIDYEFILLFKKLGTPPKVTPEQKAASALSIEEWNTYFSGHWNFAGEKQGDGHIAMFPLELPTRLVKMFSFAGETVLDPFAGSGTTLRAAINLGRRGIGYEINPEFAPAIEKRLGLHENNLFGNPTVEFSTTIVPNVSDIATSESVSSHVLERKANAHEQRFGSVIAAADSVQPKPTGKRVRRIVSPQYLILEDGSEIQLLGIKTIEEKKDAALNYLRAAILGKPIFLHFDTQTPADNGVQQAYVYLKNKTFINAKLIKQGLCEADANISHRYAERFRSYMVKVSDV